MNKWIGPKSEEKKRTGERRERHDEGSVGNGEELNFRSRKTKEQTDFSRSALI